MSELQKGIERFHENSDLAAKFKATAGGQSPHTLVITCADSRVSPDLVFGADPGSIFVIRNVGNLVPPSGSDPGMGAALEFAVGSLGVKSVVVCGHSSCGAMKAIHSKAKPGGDLAKWLDFGCIREASDPDDLSKKNVLFQLEGLRSYPILENIEVKGYWFDIGAAKLSEL